jgi:hypothetical protein
MQNDYVKQFTEFARKHAVQTFLFPHKRSLAQVVGEIIQDAPLEESPFHGPDHWLRVLANGKAILDRHTTLEGWDKNGMEYANRLTAMWLFALCHDCRREEEGECIEHGYAGALALRYHFGGAMQAHIIILAATACELHTIVRVPSDSPLMRVDAVGGLNVHDEAGLRDWQRDFYGMCMDADRLDLPRVGVRPHPHYMFNPANLQFLRS